MGFKPEKPGQPEGRCPRRKECINAEMDMAVYHGVNDVRNSYTVVGV